MRKNFRNALTTLILSFTILNCVSYKNQLHKGEGGIEKARMNVITDFVNTYKTPRYYLKKRKGKSFNVFQLTKREQLNINLYIFSILPEDQKILLNVNDSLGKVPREYIPNRYIIKQKKLFLWNDGITPLQTEILKVLDDFGVLDSINIKIDLGMLPDDYEDTRIMILDHRLEGVDYYICIDKIEKFKKVVTNKALGYYDTPKLKCST